jgi:hypothetical protein
MDQMMAGLSQNPMSRRADLKPPTGFSNEAVMKNKKKKPTFSDTQSLNYNK